MTSIVKALGLHLMKRPKVTHLVGDRIYRARRPQASAETAITIQLLSGGEDYHVGGQEPQNDPLVAVDCWANEDAMLADKHDDLVEAVRNAVSGWPGGLWGDVYVYACTIEDRRELPVAPVAGDSWTYRERLTLRVHHDVEAVVFD